MNLGNPIAVFDDRVGTRILPVVILSGGGVSFAPPESKDPFPAASL